MQYQKTILKLENSHHTSAVLQKTILNLENSHQQLFSSANSHHTSAVPENHSQPGEQPSYQCSSRLPFSTWRTAIILVQYYNYTQTGEQPSYQCSTRQPILNLENSHHTSAVLDNYSQPGEQPSYQCSTRQLFSTYQCSTRQLFSTWNSHHTSAVLPILNLENNHHTSAVLDTYSQSG